MSELFTQRAVGRAASNLPRPDISAKIGLCNVLRIEVHFGKVAARLTQGVRQLADEASRGLSILRTP